MSYQEKIKDSFYTKLDLYLYSAVLTKFNPTIESFKSLRITKEIIDSYTTKFKQYYYEDKIVDNDIRTVQDIYDKIIELKENLNESDYLEAYTNGFESILSQDQYQQLKKSKKCFYCGLDENDFHKLYDNHGIRKKANRGFNFEIDRKNPNEEYHYTNLVIACYWCKKTKTDEFSEEDFKPIGKVIGAALRARKNI